MSLQYKLHIDQGLHSVGVDSVFGGKESDIGVYVFVRVLVLLWAVQVCSQNAPINIWWYQLYDHIVWANAYLIVKQLDPSALLAQSTACPTGVQEVMGSLTPGSSSMSWRLIMKYFLRLFSPFRFLKKGNFQFLAKEYAHALVNR